MRYYTTSGGLKFGAGVGIRVSTIHPDEKLDYTMLCYTMIYNTIQYKTIQYYETPRRKTATRLAASSGSELRMRASVGITSSGVVVL